MPGDTTALLRTLPMLSRRRVWWARAPRRAVVSSVPRADSTIGGQVSRPVTAAPRADPKPAPSSSLAPRLVGAYGTLSLAKVSARLYVDFLGLLEASPEGRVATFLTSLGWVIRGAGTPTEPAGPLRGANGLWYTPDGRPLSGGASMALGLALGARQGGGALERQLAAAGAVSLARVAKEWGLSCRLYGAAWAPQREATPSTPPAGSLATRTSVQAQRDVVQLGRDLNPHALSALWEGCPLKRKAGAPRVPAIWKLNRELDKIGPSRGDLQWKV